MTTVFNHILGATHSQGLELGFNELRLLYRAAIKHDFTPIGDDTFSTFFLDQVDQGNELAKQLHDRLPGSVTISSVVNQMRLYQMTRYLQCRAADHGHVNAFIWAFNDDEIPEAEWIKPDEDDLEQIRAWLAPSAPASVKLAPWANEQDELPDVDGVNQTALDAVLTSFGVPVYSEIKQKLAAMGEAVKAAESRLPTGGLTIMLGEAKPERKSAGFPNCTAVSMKPASEVFGIDDPMLAFDVPVFEWDDAHPDVPARIEGYQFRVGLLTQMLYALIRNKRALLTGHTGTGKTTLIEQIASYLGWPVCRINLDSDMGRLDLVGRDVLKDGSSSFVDGVLPDAMNFGYLMILDEYDAGRPDVMMALQRPLEGKGLIVTEDGGRVVEPDPWFRIVATGNTRGRGDDHGSYSGTRPMNGAQLDRFTVWAEVDYLPHDETVALLTSRGADEGTASKMASYFATHTTGFKQGDTQVPMTPRTLLEWLDVTQFLADRDDHPVWSAFRWTMLARCGEADQATVQGYFDRHLL